MQDERRERRLAAILAADVVGYTRLMENDEADTYERLTDLRNSLLDLIVSKHRGRIFKIMGDGFLIEFDSVVDAVDCAIALQNGLRDYNKEYEESRQIMLRIGVNLGDVIVEDDDRYGEGVNLASRLQGEAEPGGVLISQTAYQQLASNQKGMFEDRGTRKLKNVTVSVQVYGWTENQIRVPKTFQRNLHMALAATAFVIVVAAGFASTWLRPTGTEALPPLPSGPKIAIVPLESLSEDAESIQLATGLSESISNDMSKFTDLFVLSLNATRPY